MQSKSLDWSAMPRKVISCLQEPALKDMCNMSCVLIFCPKQLQAQPHSAN